MGWGTGNVGGGSGSLNFKVAAYATEEVLLADTPKENTIGVVTDTAVPKWGFYASEPEAPEEGELFFTVATESAGSFNALKKNALTVYPTLCRQYVSGEWAKKIAYIYKSGAWVQFSKEWNGELFEQGNVHADITGGWQYDVNSTSTTITNDNTGFTFACMNGSDSSTGWFYTLGLVDLTEWNTLIFDFTRTLQEGDSSMKCLISKYKQSESSATAVGYGQTGPVSIDISSLSGSYYLSMTKWGGKFTINRIYMTK